MTIKGRLIDTELRALNGLSEVAAEVLPLPQLLELDLGEEEVQKSLCRHSEYFPMAVDTHHRNWFRWVLSKYELPSGNVTDFAYVVTTSANNTIVLVEIEDPSKKFWVGPPERPEKSTSFVRAIEQVEQWRSDLQDPLQRGQLIQEMKAMMGNVGLTANQWGVEYVLIYGRSAENVSRAQKEAFTRLERYNGIRLRTFDNLVAAQQTGESARLHNFVRVTRPGPKFSYTYLNRDPMGEFARLSPGTMLLDSEVEPLLRAKGFDIDAWKAGHLLRVNNKHPVDGGFLKGALPSLRMSQPGQPASF